MKKAFSSGRSATLSVRLLHLGIPEFDRRIGADECPTQVTFPPGPAVVGVFAAEDTARMLSKPIEVEAGKGVSIDERVPDGSDLMIVVSRLRLPMSERSKRHAPLVLSVGGQALTPDVLFESDGRIVAIWYDSPPGDARVSLDQRPILPVQLSRGTTTAVRTQIHEVEGTEARR